LSLRQNYLSCKMAKAQNWRWLRRE
jgi:hypothetical protein